MDIITFLLCFTAVDIFDNLCTVEIAKSCTDTANINSLRLANLKQEIWPHSMFVTLSLAFLGESIKPTKLIQV